MILDRNDGSGWSGGKNWIEEYVLHTLKLIRWRIFLLVWILTLSSSSLSSSEDLALLLLLLLLEEDGEKESEEEEAKEDVDCT